MRARSAWRGPQRLDKIGAPRSRGFHEACTTHRRHRGGARLPDRARAAERSATSRAVDVECHRRRMAQRYCRRRLGAFHLRAVAAPGGGHLRTGYPYARRPEACRQPVPRRQRCWPVRVLWRHAAWCGGPCRAVDYLRAPAGRTVVPSADDDGLYHRTINDFSSPAFYLWRQESSRDGVHWIAGQAHGRSLRTR